MLRQMGLAALFSIMVSFLPLIAAGAYLFRPSEQRLAMMRPLSLAGIFAGLNGSSLGAINTLRGLWLEPPRDGRILAIASAESIVPLYVSFSCLMLAWLLVAAGMWRKSCERRLRSASRGRASRCRSPCRRRRRCRERRGHRFLLAW